MEGFYLLLALLVLAIPIGSLLGIAAWSRSRRALDRIEALTRDLAALRAEVAGLRGEAGATHVPDAPAEEPAAQRTASVPIVTPAPVVIVSEPRDPDAAPVPAAEAPSEAPPPTPEPEPGAAEAFTPPAPAPAPDLEETLTLRWAVWAGAAALLLAGVFLIRYAVENAWLGLAVRCVLAALLGAALIGAGEWLRRRPPTRPLALPAPDQAPGALVAGGVSVLFGAAYAAGPLYGLVPPLLAFLLMAGAGVAGMLLSMLHGPIVAAIGIAGAFLSPVLVQTEDPSLFGLFAYLLVVTAAAVAVVRHTAWAWLGWAAITAGALWALLGGLEARGAERWAPALFVPAAAAVHLALLPRAALRVPLGRRLAWASFAALALAGLAAVMFDRGYAGIAGVLLLSLVALWKGRAEPRLDRLPWLAAGVGLLALLVWPLPLWTPTGEAITVEGVVQGVRSPAPSRPRRCTPSSASPRWSRRCTRRRDSSASAARRGRWSGRRYPPRCRCWCSPWPTRGCAPSPPIRPGRSRRWRWRPGWSRPPPRRNAPGQHSARACTPPARWRRWCSAWRWCCASIG
jgi:uncharacterized membrane protein